MAIVAAAVGDVYCRELWGGRGAAVVSFVVIVNFSSVWGKRSVAADRRVCVVRGTAKEG